MVCCIHASTTLCFCYTHYSYGLSAQPFRERGMQQRLADFFWDQSFGESKKPSLRAVAELPWLLEQLGDRERLRSCITDDAMFSSLCVELGLGV